MANSTGKTKLDGTGRVPRPPVAIKRPTVTKVLPKPRPKRK